MRCDIRSSSAAPEYAAACSTSARRFSLATSMRSLISTMFGRISVISDLLGAPRRRVSCPYLSIELFFNPCPSTADYVSRNGTALASRCYLRLVRISRLKRAGSREEKEMRVFTRPLAAAILTAGCYLSIHPVNVLAQSPPPGPSTSGPDLSDQKLSAVAAAIESLASLPKDYPQRIAGAEATA